MKLYYSRPSPFVRKVVVTLRETGLIDQVEIADTVTMPIKTAPELAAMNPLGKIPALERPDGPTLYDSRVITRYLDSLSGGKLYPAEPALWEVLTLEATADGIMEAAVLMVYEARVRDEAARSEVWVDAQWGKITRALDALEARWMAHLKGPLSAGQIAVGCALEYLDFRHGARNWRAGRPGLAAWGESFGARPSMTETTPE